MPAHPKKTTREGMCPPWSTYTWITVSSSSNEKSTDQQENWVVVREEGFTPQSNYICRVQINVWRLPKYQILTPHPLSPSECVLPPHQRRGGGVHSPGGEGLGGGGSIFWKTPDIGLASYSIIPLRFTPSVPTPSCSRLLDRYLKTTWTVFLLL